MSHDDPIIRPTLSSFGQDAVAAAKTRRRPAKVDSGIPLSTPDEDPPPRNGHVVALPTRRAPRPPKPVMAVRCAADLPNDPPAPALAVGHIPGSAVTVLCGAEGIGKSLWWVTVAAAITTGAPMPHIGLPRRHPRDVVIVITEDTWADVRARLTLAGADLRRVQVISEDPDGNGAPTFPLHMPVVAEAARRLDVALVVVDAWLDTVPGGISVKDPQQARAALHPWKELAESQGLAVLLVTHTNRMVDASTRDMIGATGALRQKGRMLLLAAARDGEEGTRMLLGPDKANSTGVTNAVEYELSVEQVRTRTDSDEGTCARLVNPHKTDKWMRHHLDEWRAAKREADRPPNAEEKAEQWVKAYMEENGGEVEANKGSLDASAAGHGRYAVKALKKLGGTSATTGSGGTWFWKLTAE